MVFAQRMHADVRTWQYFLQTVCFLAGPFFLAFLADVFWGFSFTAGACEVRTCEVGRVPHPSRVLRRGAGFDFSSA